LVYPLTNKNIEKIYRKFIEIRFLELEISKRYSEGKMRCPVHLSIGQEIVPAILSLLVNKSDFFISTHRGHAHYIAKNGNISEMISEIYGKNTGTSKGKGGSMHLIDTKVNFMGTSAIVGNSIPVGVGLGLSNKINNKKSLSFVFFGDGATEEGVFYEAVNFSAVKEIPVVYICENNKYSVYSPLDVRQPKNRDIHKILNGMGIKTFFSHSKSLNEIHSTLNRAIKYTKIKRKPVFIECMTSRWLEHCGPNNDDSLEYRDIKELEAYKKNDFQKKLESKLENDFVSKTQKEVLKKINFAFKFAELSPTPKKKDLKSNVFKT
jgi:pyruvate dehydrogenase E1 component alpha subunit